MRSDRRVVRWALALVALAALVVGAASCEFGGTCANGICSEDLICDDGGCGPLDGGVTFGDAG